MPLVRNRDLCSNYLNSQLFKKLAEPLLRRNVLVTFHDHAHLGTIQGHIGNGSKVYNVALPIFGKKWACMRLLHDRNLKPAAHGND